MRLLIDKTMGSALDTTGEIQQLTHLFSGIRVALRSFNVKTPVYNGPDIDIAFSDLSSGTKYIFAEGKASSYLPQRLTKDGHHLCTVGFATKVAKVVWASPSTTKGAGCEKEQIESTTVSRCWP